MNKLIKFLIVFSFCYLLFIFVNIGVKAEDSSPIYYEDEILEVNELAGGLIHRKVKGYSQVTDATSIDSGAKEAGLGSTKPLILNQYYSQQLNILEIPNESKTKLVPWGVISNGKWSLNKVTQMAEDYEKENPGWKVIAAINGDFFDINGNGNLRYTPSGTMMVEGDMYKVNTGWPMLAINNNNQGDKLVGIWRNTVSQSSNPYLYIYDQNDNIIKEFEINKINSEPNESEISLYMAFFDSNHKIVNQDVINGYIVESAIDTVAFSRTSIFGKGLISKVGDLSLGLNQFAIKTQNDEVKNYLNQNTKIKVQYKLNNEVLSNCDSIIGYHDNVLINGEFCYENDGYGSARLPRTLLGTKADGSIMMVVVDGRQPNSGFYGISNQETCSILEHYGLVNAFQMDGGGSATMVVLKNGQLEVVNSPSDSNGLTARSDSDCILVAMEVPTIEYSVNYSEKQVEIFVDVVKEIDKYKDLYIDLNGEKKKVTDGKVLFTDLQGHTDYVYEFYALVDGNYESIVYQGNVHTTKQKPELTNILLSVVNVDGVTKYEINMELVDPHDSVSYAVLYIGENKYWLKNNKFSFTINEVNILNTDDWYIELNYNTLSKEGMTSEDIKNCGIKMDLTSVLDSQLESIQNTIKGIFSN